MLRTPLVVLFQTDQTKHHRLQKVVEVTINIVNIKIDQLFLVVENTKNIQIVA